MASIKEKLIKDIQNMDDEALLQQVYDLLHSMRDLKVIELNDEQRQAVQEGREDYKQGDYYDTDTLFNDLLNE